ncbi:membrane protein DedA, SNARE-associated domain [Raineyella antarctica]|uniref:Membrane protein DedA, SNARE-associated domain n=1 Tax=Raineyella antarctica TaxID=1577474 RepID=A0A1G6HKJ9_9ACTN|nr:DedA family protein [Raineyella antarctica]SDB94445.1 membrane protein DedA, SNARE-associated domain [Raineyella antarctica]
MSLVAFLQSVPPLAVYLVIGALVMVESLGVPVPGETALITGAVMSTQPDLRVSSLWVFVAAFSGAVVGDSIGYGVGRRYGHSLLGRLEKRFPHHVSRDRIAYAQYLFDRYGMGTVFLGRFIAVLRILAGPLAGMMRMSYPRFLLANPSGAACWAGLITLVIHLLGTVAGKWFSGAAWVLLAVVLVIGAIAGKLGAGAFQRHVDSYVREQAAIAD